MKKEKNQYYIDDISSFSQAVNIADARHANQTFTISNSQQSVSFFAKEKTKAKAKARKSDR